MILIVTNVFNGDIRAVLTISQLLKYRNVYTYANIKITGGFTLFYCADVALLVFSVVNALEKTRKVVLNGKFQIKIKTSSSDVNLQFSLMCTFRDPITYV